MNKYLQWASVLMLAVPFTASAQKKPLDHSVYDAWQSTANRLVSNNGQWVTYTIMPQEGDNQLVVVNTKSNQQITIQRGAGAQFTADNKYLVCNIKPFFADVRQGKIKKKKADEMPKDSMAILQLENFELSKVPNVKSFKVPSEGNSVFAYLVEKPKDTTSAKKPSSTSAKAKTDGMDADDDKPGGGSGADVGDLVIFKYGKQITRDSIKHVNSYTIANPGNRILVEITTFKKDSLSKPGVLLYTVATSKRDTVSRGNGDFKQFTFDDKGEQFAYVVSRDSSKALQKFYHLAYYQAGFDTARTVVTKATNGMPAKWAVSENGNISFSKDGSRVFFGTAAVKPPKDTTIVDFEVAKLDIWHYKDDYLQTMQLKNVDQELKRSYAALYYPSTQKFIQLADTNMETFVPSLEGNPNWGVGSTDKGNRIRIQWEGNSLRNIYLVNTQTGERKLVVEKHTGSAQLSPAAKYIMWYNEAAKQYYAYEVATGTTRNITSQIPTPLYDVENDVPDEPNAYGNAGWFANDQYVYIYDRYDIWQVDPLAKAAPVNITGGLGAKNKIEFRNTRLDRDEKFFSPKQTLYLGAFNTVTKDAGAYTLVLKPGAQPQQIVMGAYSFGDLMKAKNADFFVFTRSTYVQSPNVYAGKSIATAVQLSDINQQQKDYNWGTAELFSWQTFNGKTTQGILYKPEDFDASKKYPVILYFYEKLTDGLHGYQAPAPTPSRLNISFFVSRGYIVMAPDITYEKGHPGQGAYDYIVSGAEALAKLPYVDGKNMGIQGQSWGGYQVAYLITRTNLFKAAWAGAPVANMTSAYGGIRWESGMTRQFQYEHGQSRIGENLWDNQALYIENSPLFFLPKVTTPLVIMANDADGAVPWYQGIELFTGLRRLGKPVWMLNYNNEAHNLIQRQNRKDIQRREQQFFDYYLKGGPKVEWIETGVPATEKGKNWGWDEVK
ncbi:prolyl oligopeptidase family protein [Chitinophaga skermanii]|uniref:Prolyl oligopeptidase family protein n=1 Tax=Chitinophaga skermanii TaxID=331697 RepID=A0A327QKD5_9BACT|nr:prolyl oligopeptidase family serine peptidase [Chitinophaga skermanii]RAJ05106.1 prolyl oligopeptidase family protein [Chitinophaga skermanii]